MELQAELNRLAGTSGIEAQAAANVWAGTTSLDLLGALNAKNGTVGLGFNAVCNQLAGTSGLEAQAALAAATSSDFDPVTGVAWDHLWWASALDLDDQDPVPEWPDEVGGADLTCLTADGVFGATAGPNGQPRVSGTAFVSSPGEVTLTAPCSLVVIEDSPGFICDGNISVPAPGLKADVTTPADLTADGSTTITVEDEMLSAKLLVFYLNGAASEIRINGTTVATGDTGTLTYLDPLLLVSTAWSLVGVYDGDVADDPGWDDLEAWAIDLYDLDPVT